MSWDASQIADFLVWIFFFLLCAAVLVFCLWMGFRAISGQYRDQRRSRMGQIGLGLVLLGCGSSLLAMFGAFTEIGYMPAPTWHIIGAAILICATGAMFMIGLALMLLDEIAKMRADARESGNGFWISRHNDG